MRLAQAGDLAGARTAFEAAYRATDGTDPEALARRASTLMNLAALAEPADAARLCTEAIELTVQVEAAAGDRFGTVVLRAAAYAARAQAAAQDGRVADAERDVDLGLAVAANTGPEREFLMAALHNVRASLLTHGEPAGVIGPRWHHCVELNTRGAMLAQSGDFQGAAATFDEAYRLTLGADDDVEALVCRAAIAGNRAGLATTLGDFDTALRCSTETIELSRVIEARVGDQYGTTSGRVGALSTRAQYLRYRSRYDDALRDLDEAFAALPATTANNEIATVNLHTVRASVLAAAGRFDEGMAAARAALALADEKAPHLAPYTHMSLADIADSVGDTATSAEHLHLAQAIFAAAGDQNGEATALLSLGRLSYLADRHDEADERYAAAEALFGRIGNSLQLMTCLHGRAAVAVRRGRPREALALLDRVLAAGGANAAPVVLVATYQVQGSALEALGEFAQAEERYAAACESSRAAGLWHATLGIDWWRADTLARWAAAAPTMAERVELRRRSLDRALPAALAAEAVRQRFAHGPLRERWVALATAPATRAALSAITALNDVELAAAYIDHLAAAVSLTAAPGPARREDVLSLPAPPSGPATDLPPRVRVDPAVRSPLDDWLDLAEERYGVAVRAPGVVRSW